MKLTADLRRHRASKELYHRAAIEDLAKAFDADSPETFAKAVSNVVMCLANDAAYNNGAEDRREWNKLARSLEGYADKMRAKYGMY